MNRAWMSGDFSGHAQSTTACEWVACSPDETRCPPTASELTIAVGARSGTPRVTWEIARTSEPYSWNARLRLLRLNIHYSWYSIVFFGNFFELGYMIHNCHVNLFYSINIYKVLVTIVVLFFIFGKIRNPESWWYNFIEVQSKNYKIHFFSFIFLFKQSY